MFVGALYNSPKPTNHKDLLINTLDKSIEEFTCDSRDILIALGGDFNSNSLEITELVERPGLHPLVKDPTRGGNNLDRFMFQHLASITPKSSPLS